MHKIPYYIIHSNEQMIMCLWYDHRYLDSELIVGGGGVGCQIEGVFAIAQLSPRPTGEASLKSDWLDDAAKQHDSTHQQAEPCPGGWRNHDCEHYTDTGLVKLFNFSSWFFSEWPFTQNLLFYWIIKIHISHWHVVYYGKGGGQEEKKLPCNKEWSVRCCYWVS